MGAGLGLMLLAIKFPVLEKGIQRYVMLKLIPMIIVLHSFESKRPMGYVGPPTLSMWIKTIRLGLTTPVVQLARAAWHFQALK